MKKPMRCVPAIRRKPNAMKDSQEVNLADVAQKMGGEYLTYRAGHIIQYERQRARGLYLPVSGTLRLIYSRPTRRIELHQSRRRFRLFPDPTAIDLPLPYTIEAAEDIALWFFARTVCLKEERRRLFEEALNLEHNPLHLMWSGHRYKE